MHLGYFLNFVLLSCYCTQWFVQAFKDIERIPIGATRKPVSVSYQDLKDAVGNRTCSPKKLLGSIAKAFGPDGLGLLEVSDIPPAVVKLRSDVLGMAETLARLPTEQLEEITIPSSMYSIGWSHGREQFRGEYDTGKGSFYFDPFHENIPNHNVYPSSMQPDLEHSLLEISTRMAEIGSWVASLCDLYLQEELKDKQQSEGEGIETMQNDRTENTAADLSPETISIRQSLDSGKYAKGRLLYYFPAGINSQNSVSQSEEEEADESSSFDSWCGWHKDHSSLTILIPGKLFEDQPGETRSEQCKGNKPGLYIQSQGQAVHVQLPSTSIGVQLGETVEIMSAGQFRATRHAVKGSSNPTTGRASLALFLQPSMETTLPQLYLQAADESLRQRWRPTYGDFQDATFAAFL
ncbi:MAG: hypothetical protein SGBAC_011792 [Bacillariaceae sp.]